MKWIRLVILTLPLMASGAWAHGGGLNKDGCHNDRKNGGYHCHRSNTPLQSQINSAPRAQFTSGTTSSASNARARSFDDMTDDRSGKSFAQKIYHVRNVLFHEHLRAHDLDESIMSVGDNLITYLAKRKFSP